MLKHYYVHFENPADRSVICAAIRQANPAAEISDVFTDSLLVASVFSRSRIVFILEHAGCSARFTVLQLRADPSRPVLEIFRPLTFLSRADQ